MILLRTDCYGKGQEISLEELETRERGAERIARCPFHEDSRPSLWINLEKRCFHCFGCEARGVVKVQQGPLLATFYKPVCRRVASLEKVEERHRLLEDALTYASGFLNLKAARTYLEGRDIPEEQTQVCQAGFFPGNMATFLSFLIQRGWDAENIGIEHALFWRSRTGRLHLSLAGRLIFPLTVKGKIANLAGRLISSRTDQERKWLFLKNIQDHAKGVFSEKSLSESRVILTESVFDAMAWLMRGRPAIGLMGVHLPEWIVPFLRGKEVYLALNGDGPGVAATRAITERLRGVAREIRVIVVPSVSTDWNEYHCGRVLAMASGEVK